MTQQVLQSKKQTVRQPWEKSMVWNQDKGMWEMLVVLDEGQRSNTKYYIYTW